MALFREEVDDAVQRLVGIVGVQSGKTQVASLGKGQRMFHGLLTADLADQDDIGCLTQCVLQRFFIALGIHAHFALIDDGLLVLVYEFHRVFDGDDVAVAVGIAVVDQGCERGGLARARATNEQHKAAFLHDQFGQHFGQSQRLPAWYFRLDIAGDDGDLAALLEDVDAEAADVRVGNGQIHFGAFLEILDLFRRHDLVGDLLHGARRQRLSRHGHELAIGLHAGWCPGGQEEVRALFLDHDAQQIFEAHACVLCSGECRIQNRRSVYQLTSREVFSI